MDTDRIEVWGANVRIGKERKGFDRIEMGIVDHREVRGQHMNTDRIDVVVVVGEGGVTVE